METKDFPHKIKNQLKELGFNLHQLDLTQNKDGTYSLIDRESYPAHEYKDEILILLHLNNPNDKQRASIASLYAVAGRSEIKSNDIKYTSHLSFEIDQQAFPQKEELIVKLLSTINAKLIYETVQKRIEKLSNQKRIHF